MENSNYNTPENNEEKLKKENQEAADKASTNPAVSGEVDGIVGERTTGSNPLDRAGIADLDRGMARGSRRNS